MQALTRICDVVRWAATRFEQAELFYGHGTDNAWDDARALVITALHLPFEHEAAYWYAALTEAEKAHLFDLVEQRCKTRLPVPYLTNTAYFAGLKFYVDQRVLIPRSPFAELIQNGFAGILTEPPQRALDLCTGSGCIAIAMAVYDENLQVDAIDIDSDALAVAELNRARHAVQDRVRLIQSDLCQQLSAADQYDLIVSNPPYVPTASFNALPAEYRAEPQRALEAGEDGLSLFLPLLRQSVAHLNPEGVLVVEVGEAQAALEEQYPDFPGVFLDFEQGGMGIFAVGRSALAQWLAIKLDGR